MGKDKYRIGFWNYVDTDVLDEKAVKDWVDLGFNLAMSFEFDPGRNDKNRMLRVLDECAKKNIEVIVCDKRAHWTTLEQLGEEEYRRGMECAVRDFGSHPAVFGFHIGDEPGKSQFNNVCKAFRIAQECAPDLKPFVNLLPYWDEPSFEPWLGVKPSDYKIVLDDLAKRTQMKQICYDCYAQCTIKDSEFYLEWYFINLNYYRAVAKANGIEAWTSLLSVGHWGYRCPDENDFRWQISTAVAHGMTGLLWFFVYERAPHSSYRLSPIDVFWERTETFERLSRQNRMFLKYFAPKLERYSLEKVEHFKKSYGGTPIFSGSDELLNIEYLHNPVPLIISRFTDENGTPAFVIVNNSQTEVTEIKTVFRENSGFYSGTYWFAPGQMYIFEWA